MAEERDKVLVADDEEVLVELVSNILLKEGYEVVKAYDGEEALKLIEKQEYDVVVLDVRMPGPDGNQILKIIKKRNPLTEVIMLTGHATVQIAIDGMKSGAYDFLIKPVDTNLLVEKINLAHTRKSEHEERIRQAEIDNIVKHKGW